MGIPAIGIVKMTFSAEKLGGSTSKAGTLPDVMAAEALPAGSSGGSGGTMSCQLVIHWSIED
jgi:hypothetical protein